MPAYAQFLLLLAIIVIFWAIVMRPARSRQRKIAGLQEELEVGDEVVITAGIFGVVRSVDGARVELEVAPGTVLTVARQVVVRRADDVPPAAGETATSGNAEPAPGTAAETATHMDDSTEATDQVRPPAED